MNRKQAILVAIGVTLAFATTSWAIGVNSGIITDGQRHEPVSARLDITGTAGPEVVETVYVDVPAATPDDPGLGADSPVTTWTENSSIPDTYATTGSQHDRRDDDEHEDDDDEHEDERKASKSSRGDSSSGSRHDEKKEKSDDD